MQNNYSKIDVSKAAYLVGMVSGEKEFAEKKYELNGKFIYCEQPSDKSEIYNYLKNYRPYAGIEAGNSKLVLFPNSTEQVAAILKYCSQNKIKVFTQGGNSGLVGGSTPDSSGDGIVLSLKKMNKVLSEVDENSLTIKLEAGVVIDDLNNAILDKHGLFCSIKHGGTGLATIGGSVATNSGGANAIKYGVTREQVIGLKVVTASGDILNLGGCVKDNSYPINLMHMFIGSEGLLGVVTEVEICVHNKPLSFETALIGMKLDDIDAFLGFARKEFGNNIEAFEFMENRIFNISKENTISVKSYLADIKNSEVFILMEVSSHNANDEILKDKFQNFIFKNTKQHEEIIVAQSQSDREKIWSVREHCSDSSAQYCGRKGVFFDNSVPLGKIADSLKQTRALLIQEFSEEFKSGALDVYGFGHWADGNIHHHVVSPKNTNCDLNKISPQIEKIVLDYNINVLGGNWAAEHGNGAKLLRVKKYGDNKILELLKALKSQFDINNIMNPGRGM